MLRDSVDRFLVSKRQAGCSPLTVERYRWHLVRLVAWLEAREIRDVGDLDRDVLRTWGAGLYDDWQPATVKLAVTAVRSWLAWCREEELIAVDLARALKSPSVPKKAQRTITVDEVRRLLDGCDRESVKGLRDYALIHVLVDTGLRLAEVCALQLTGVSLDQRRLAVRIKGGAVDYGFFGEYTVDAIRAWLEVRPALVGVGELFTSTGGGTLGTGLSPRSLRGLLQRLGRKVGIEGVCPHAFRRAFACIASDAGAPTRLVMGAGRWANIEMVVRYTQAMSRRQMYEHEEWVPMNHVLNGDRNHDGSG